MAIGEELEVFVYFPDAVDGEICAFGGHGLGDEGDSFAPGSLVRGSAEELSRSAKGCGEGSSGLDLLDGVLLPARNAWDLEEEAGLEILYETRGDFQMPGDGRRLAQVGRTVASAFAHIPVGHISVENLLGNFSVLLDILGPGELVPDKAAGLGVEISSFDHIKIGPVFKKAPHEEANFSAFTLLHVYD